MGQHRPLEPNGTCDPRAELEVEKNFAKWKREQTEEEKGWCCMSDKKLRRFLERFDGEPVQHQSDEEFYERYGGGLEWSEMLAMLTLAFQRCYLELSGPASLANSFRPFPRCLTEKGDEFVRRHWWTGHEIALAGVVLGALGILERFW